MFFWGGTFVSYCLACINEVIKSDQTPNPTHVTVTPKAQFKHCATVVLNLSVNKFDCINTDLTQPQIKCQANAALSSIQE